MSSPTKDSQQPPTTKSGRKKVGAPLGNANSAKYGSCRPDLVGRQYGSVKIVSPEIEWRHGGGTRRAYVEAECCGCGRRSVIALGNLERGRTKGCRSCNQPVRFPKWLYRRMQSAQQRCINPKAQGYADYGGRGVTFDFPTPAEAALWVQQNLGLPENPKAVEIDRINNDAGYGPGNLRWATPQHNKLNQRSQPTAKMHAFRMAHPEVRYADATLKRLFVMGLTDADIVERFSQPSCKPKGKYGTFSKPDPEIASLLRDF